MPPVILIAFSTPNKQFSPTRRHCMQNPLFRSHAQMSARFFAKQKDDGGSSSPEQAALSPVHKVTSFTNYVDGKTYIKRRFDCGFCTAIKRTIDKSQRLSLISGR